MYNPDMEASDILKDVNLRYTHDRNPGFSRKLVGEKFEYFDIDRKRIKDEKTIERINKLVIPPAYTKVWISPYANGHLQTTGYDKKGRKQYRYHPLWTAISQREKFAHVMSFAKILPKIRSKVRYDLEKPGISKEKILATVIWLLENTLIRVGNEEYEVENNSFGLTTMQKRHAKVKTEKIAFQFKGKSGVYHKVSVKNKKIASIVRRCEEIPGQDLFEYFDEDGNIHKIDSYDVNQYLRKATGQDITTKDFRTWAGTVLAATAFNKLGISEDESLTKKNIVDIVKEVAAVLGNRPSTCRKYYIHPAVIEAYLDGHIISNLLSIQKKKRYRSVNGLGVQENEVLALLTYSLPE